KTRDEYLHTLDAETERLNRLVVNVLDFSRLENQQPRLNCSIVKIPDLFDETLCVWDKRCEDAGKQLVVENGVPEEEVLETDAVLLQQLLGNLIDNACKYSREAADPRIWVRSRVEGPSLLLEVEDRGPGILGRERRTIFLPFR